MFTVAAIPRQLDEPPQPMIRRRAADSEGAGERVEVGIGMKPALGSRRTQTLGKALELTGGVEGTDRAKLTVGSPNSAGQVRLLGIQEPVQPVAYLAADPCALEVEQSAIRAGQTKQRRHFFAPFQVGDPATSTSDHRGADPALGQPLKQDFGSLPAPEDELDVGSGRCE